MAWRRTVIVAACLATAGLSAAGCGGGSSSSSTSTTGRPAPSTTRGTTPHVSPTGSGATTSTPTSIPAPTSTTAPGGSVASLDAVLQAFFANGCNGVCTRLSEPTTAFTVVLDQHDPSWARWSVVDPSIGSGYGFAHVSGGAWAIVAGPGSAGVGCPPSGGVPRQVLSDFGAACPS